MEPEVRPAPPAPASPAAKVRFRFKKGGDLRLLSHHDLLRAFERMLRRAALPVRASQGFHPKPRLVFALSLPLGVVGLEEVAELELDEPLSADEVRERLARQAPPGLEILSAEAVAPRAQAQVRRLVYRLEVPADRRGALAERVAEVLAAPQWWVERTRPTARRVDLRPFINDLRIVEVTASEAPEPPATPSPSPLKGGESEDAPRSPAPVYLEMDLALTPTGTARPDEVLAALGLRDLLDAGAVLERARLELDDETPPSAKKGSGVFSAGKDA